MQSPIHALSFDLDDTLWPCQPTLQQAEQKLHEWLTIYYPRLPERFSIAALREMRLQLLATYPHLACDTSTLRKLNLTRAASAVGYTDELVEPAFAVFYEARQQVQLYDDVLPVLERLHRRYILCSLTNGNANVQRTRIGHLFDLSLLSSEVGAAKPHPALFETASQRIGVKLAHIVHVGDDVMRDVGGALTVGMRAVWMNRDAKVYAGPQAPHATVTSMLELETLLTQWENFSGRVLKKS